MSTQIPSQYILQYQDEMRLAYQFEGNKLRRTCMSGKHEGAGASPADYVGPMTANYNPARLAPTPNSNPTVTRRWVAPTKVDLGTLIDKQDVTRVFNGGQLQSQYAMAQGKAMARADDDLICGAFYATATTGQTGSGTTIFTAGNVVAYNFEGGTGCTVAKLIEGVRLLESGGVDVENEEMYCIITSADNAYLKKQLELRSREYTDTPILNEKGGLKYWAGIEFIHLEFTNTTQYPIASNALAVPGYTALYDGTYRYLPLYAKSAMYLGQWRPTELRVSERADISYATQVYTDDEAGATRLQEAGVTLIQCS